MVYDLDLDFDDEDIELECEGLENVDFEDVAEVYHEDLWAGINP